MQAMDPAAADFYEEDGKDLDFYDFEPLPTLPEDEENVSLADILSLRDSGLSEQEAWAVCLECSLSMRSVAHSAIFQTLCITPDTLAFNTSGNVCFMEQLSDDPEGAFVPPEFDVTGNTFEAHIYSLGATLKAALDYVTEPEPQPRLSRELEALLGQMQAEDPGERPDLQSIIALCEEKMQLTSSCRLCQSLSAAGRRVLSIESFGAFQDVSEITWRERLAPKSVGPKRQPGARFADPAALPALEGRPPSPAGEGLEHPGTPPSKALLSAPVKNGESPGQEGLVPERLACLLLDAQRPLGDPDRGFLERSRLRKVQTLPRLPPCGPEAGALCLSLTSTKTQPPAPEFFPPDPRKPFPEGKNGLTGFQAQPESSLWPKRDAELRRGGDRGARGRGPAEESSPPGSKGPRDSGRDPGTPEPDDGTADRAGEPGGAALEQGVSLQDLLSKLGRPFKECELWALSHACLSALRTHGQHPAYLCLDSVLVAEDGTVFFGPPPASGAYNSLFLAPEVAEQKLTTEKASVYCVAAILWTAAKFSIPRDHKLALPRRLKTLLLHMARRSAQERPSAAEAVETCSSYLLHRGMDSRKILAHLRASTCTVCQEEEAIGLQNAFSVVELSPSTAAAPRPGSGFMQTSSDSRLVAVQGPVPGQPSCLQGATLQPEAFTSPATHFRPIVLAANAGVARGTLALTSGPAERPEERRGHLDGEGDEAHGVATGLKTPDQPAPGSPEPLRESTPRDSAQGCPSPPAPAPASPPEGASLVLPKSPAPAPPMTTQMPPPERGPKEPIPTADACGGLGPRPPGPTAAPHSPCHPAKPPRSRATQGPGQEPEGPPGAPAREWGDQAPEGHPEWPYPADHKICPSSVDASPLPQGTACPSLQEATRLIQEEFAFDGYLDHGLEALIMGEYIYALKDLTYATFCGAISEKFCDLYWGERLLQNLFRVVNGRTSPSENTSEEAGSQPGCGGGTSAPSTGSPSSKRPSHLGAGKEKPSVDSDELPRSNFEMGFRPQKSVKAARDQQPQAGEARQQGGSLAGDSEAVDRLARPLQGGPSVSPGPGGLQSCSPGWCSAFYEADCFSADVHRYVKELARQKAAGCPAASAQSPELEQQLMIEKRNFRKTLKFHQKLLQKEKRNKGSEVKIMLSKLKAQLEEMRSKVQFLGLVKKYLQVMYAERWGLEPCALPVIVNIAAAHCDTLDFSPLDESSSLIFYNASKHPRGGRQRKARVLQAGTPLGLMAYLYSSDAFLEGYVQQFLYTFRYFCSPHDFLHFLLDRISSTLSRAHQDPTSTSSKIYRRSFCLLQAWLEDCYAVDFRRDAGLLGRLQDYLASQILPLDGSAEPLLGLLEVGTERRAEGAPRSTDLQDPKEAEDAARPLNALWKRLSEDGVSRKSFPWRLSRGNGLALPHHKERQYSIASALPKPCFFEDFYGPYARAGEKGPYFLTEYSTHQLFSQLTLLQQELFHKCHPVHFLNSRALGVTDKSVAVPKASSSEALSAKTCSLFLPNYVQDKYLLQLLRSADDVSTWVAAEIVTSLTSKLQVNLLSKFLLLAKSCYEQRNFATAMQILGGLEQPAVRRCPAWRILPAKIAEIMEELKAVEVFLKSDSLCLMEGRRFRAQPTLPSAHLLAMHIQQLETGGFTMTNGAHRWSKLRNIAKVASQVHAFQENPYTFAPDPKLQSHLKQRIARFSGADISILAEDSRAGSQQVASEKHSKKIQDKLRRMKATFQ
ncbi:kinase non-catalytic C-lobe domain-containing protein 1 [Physeter macrocephalus]|uniref:Kinase non-catalytic C-lobe domain-containing protein 1 n=1 Tax=Physeter macrocephalus TaxID=9755 RepID=A0A2Y9SJ45_PHYMC|nr:kinase non-catalytic C-lobe domain-containing protein 1 [Physeter catodon]|eukprot:XP_023977412.1 kinase non-catalytic C-lobe domain-containing protein 1 [Physeter catodon]